jgi:excisionase family DNA binding protein
MLDRRTEMFTTAEVARALAVSADYVRDAIRAGQLPAYRFGRGWRIMRTDLGTFMQRMRRPLEEPQRNPLDEVLRGEDQPPAGPAWSGLARRNR